MQHVIVDLVREIAYEYMVVIGGIFLACVVGLVSPVDANLLLYCQLQTSGTRTDTSAHAAMNPAAIEGLHRSIGIGGIVIFNEPIIEPFALLLRSD